MRSLSTQLAYGVTYSEGMVGPCDKDIIDEFSVGPWLDGICADASGEAWSGEVKHWRDKFVAACLADLRAFQSSPELAEAFDRMFDGTEIPPQSLAAECARLMDDEPLRASEPLVPISPGQLAQARGAGKVVRAPREDPVVVDVAYDPERGLALESTGYHG